MQRVKDSAPPRTKSIHERSAPGGARTSFTAGNRERSVQLSCGRQTGDLLAAGFVKGALDQIGGRPFDDLLRVFKSAL
jgi:hypothetical protein